MTDKLRTVEEYIAARPEAAQERLRELRACLSSADPDAVEELKWGKPALVNNGVLYMYAAARKHVSLHPTPSVIRHFRSELEPFRLSDNTVQFPLDKPIPKALVVKLARRRVYEKKVEGIGWK